MTGFFGHHKCASLWIFYIALDLAARLGRRVGFYPTAADFGCNFDKNIRNRGVEFFAWINADPRYVQLVEGDRTFHVIRDPRDMAISAYFSHRYSHSPRGWPELKPHRARLERLSFDEGLLADMAFCRSLPTNGFEVRPYDAMRNWDYGNPRVMEVRFEQLVRDPAARFIEIFQFLGWTKGANDRSESWSLRFKSMINQVLVRARSPFLFRLPLLGLRQIEHVVHQQGFSRQSGNRTPGQENKRHHYRKGVEGDWKNHFTDSHKRYFKQHHGDLLLKLGYEQDDAW